jgi:hypothetical protein
MNTYVKAFGAASITLALTAPALAASGPSFSTAKPGAGMDVNAFRPDVNTYNRSEIRDLLNARKVSVVRIDSAWKDDGDAGKAFNAVNRSSQAINLLREGLKANPAAARLLSKNHINVNTVVDITSVGNGTVQLYVS